LKEEYSEFPTRYISIRNKNLQGLLSHYYLPNWILICIKSLFQLEFAWNHDTVNSLTRSGIVWHGKDCQLSSLKPKVGSTQIAWVDKQNKGMLKLIKLIERQDDNVRKFWEREDEKVFSCWTSGKDYPKFVIIADDRLLKRFQSAYGLPYFTAEQLRDQAANTFYLKQKDPHAIQALLGHTSLSTTHIYLDQTINRVLNDANMHEFMQRLGASIIWAVKGDESLRRYGFSKGDVDRKLLFPVTDQSSLEGEDLALCDKWINQSVTKIIIDANRISHAIRQRLYYQLNWERLHNNNPDRFFKVHMGRIIFNQALCRVLEESKFGKLFQRISKEISKEIAK